MIDTVASIQPGVPQVDLYRVQSPVSHPVEVPIAQSPEAAPMREQEGSAISIQLSPEAKTRLLKSEGQTIPEIALKLRIPEDTVSSYLNLLV